MKKDVIPTRYFYGYTIIIAGFIIQAVGWGLANSLGVFFDPLIKAFDCSRATVSGVVSLGFLVHGASSIAIGNLNDKFGPRPIMSGCGILLGLGFLLMSGVNKIWHLYLFFGLIASVGLGGIDVIPLSTISRWFQKKRGIMSGIVKVGTGLGMFLMPFFINWLICNFGWRTAFFVFGVINISVILALAQFLVKAPIDKGQFVDNEEKSESESSNQSQIDEEGLVFKDAIATKEFRILCIIYVIIMFCAATIIMHIVQHALDLGISSGMAAGVISIIGGVSIVGRLVMGGTADRVGEKRALLICFLCLLISLCWLQLVKSYWMFTLFALVYGFAHGGFFALISPVVAAFFGTRSHGILLGIVIFCGTIGGAAGPVMAGYIFDITTNYRIVFLILTGLCGTALAMTTFLKPPRLEEASQPSVA